MENDIQKATEYVKQVLDALPKTVYEVIENDDWYFYRVIATHQWNDKLHRLVLEFSTLDWADGSFSVAIRASKFYLELDKEKEYSHENMANWNPSFGGLLAVWLDSREKIGLAKVSDALLFENLNTDIELITNLMIGLVYFDSEETGN